MEAKISKFVAMQQKGLFLTMALLICVMLHCIIQLLEWQSPQKFELVQKLQTNP